MATRSNIAVKFEDGKWYQIYCHWDGHPSHHLPILQDNYDSQELAGKLLEKGDMSELCETIDECSYYADRGETGVEMVEMTNGPIRKEEFLYTFDGKGWLCQG